MEAAVTDPPWGRLKILIKLRIVARATKTTVSAIVFVVKLSFVMFIFFPPPALSGSGYQGRQNMCCPLSRDDPAPLLPLLERGISKYLSMTEKV